MEERPDRFGVVLESEHPEAVVDVVLQLSAMRSYYLLGRALATKFPTEAEWLAAVNRPEFVEMVDEFAQSVADVRASVALGPTMTPETVQRAVDAHYQRALEGIDEFAKMVEVDGEVLLAALVN